MVPTVFQAREEAFGPCYLTDLHTQCWQVRILTFLPLLKGSTDRAGILPAQASQNLGLFDFVHARRFKLEAAVLRMATAGGDKV